MQVKSVVRYSSCTIIMFAGLVHLITGCGQAKPTYKPTGVPKVKLEMKLAKATPFPGGEALTLSKDQPVAYGPDNEPLATLYVSREVILRNEDIAETSADVRNKEWSDAWQVEVFLTPAGREKFARFSRDNVGHYMAVFLDGKLALAPKLTTEITEGCVCISSTTMTEVEAIKLAKELVGQ